MSNDWRNDREGSVMACNINHWGVCVHIRMNFGFHVVISQQATDRDTGDNKKIEFQVILVEFVSTNLNDKPKPTDLIFYAETEQQLDTNGDYRGIIK